MIKAIIFDLWSTVLEKGVSLSGSVHTHFHVPYCQGFVKRYERAIQRRRWPSREREAKALLRAFRIPVQRANIAYVVSMLKRSVSTAKPNPGIPPLLRRLHRGYRIGLLSNTSSWEEGAVARAGVRGYFHAMVFSFHVGSLKPAKKPYQAILRKLKVRPAESLFVDDAQENVIAARKMGMQAVWYQNTRQLERELRKRGIRTEAF